MNIDRLRELSKREFAKIIRGLNKNEIVGLIREYGVFVSFSKKVDELLDLLLDIVDGLITPTDKDKRKLESSSNKIKLTEEDKEVIKEAKDFLNIDGMIYMMVSEMDISKGDELEQEVKAKFRKLSLKLHTDTASAAIKKYHKNLFTRINNHKDVLLNLLTTTKKEQLKEENEKEKIKKQCKKHSEELMKNIDEDCPF